MNTTVESAVGAVCAILEQHCNGRYKGTVNVKVSEGIRGNTDASYPQHILLEFSHESMSSSLKHQLRKDLQEITGWKVEDTDNVFQENGAEVLLWRELEQPPSGRTNRYTKRHEKELSF